METTLVKCNNNIMYKTNQSPLNHSFSDNTIQEIIIDIRGTMKWN